MRSVPNDPSAVDHEDLLRISNGEEAMGDHHERLALDQTADRPLDESLVLVIGTCSAIAFWFARFSAGFGLALYVYRTTGIGQMKAALRAVPLPRVFVDALVVAFRVLPTVGAEAVAIREAMEMRGVDLGVRGVVRHPLVIAERFLVPLLSSIARVADDLAASSVIRGLGGSTRPTSLTRLRATAWDVYALTCVAGVIAIETCAYLGVLP